MAANCPPLAAGVSKSSKNDACGPSTGSGTLGVGVAVGWSEDGARALDVAPSAGSLLGSAPPVGVLPDASRPCSVLPEVPRLDVDAPGDDASSLPWTGGVRKASMTETVTAATTTTTAPRTSPPRVEVLRSRRCEFRCRVTSVLLYVPATDRFAHGTISRAPSGRRRRHPAGACGKPRAGSVARMAVQLTRLDPTGADREALLAFLTTEDFPFHVRPRTSTGDAERAIDAGAWDDDEHRSYWLDDDEHGRVGVLRLEDLADPVPLFDLRIAGEHRGRGLGVPALRAATDHVFTSMPEVTRFEGQTREDNTAMRRVFLRAGWVKEAHYRDGWPVEGGAPLASVAYGVLRRDWESGTTTPVPWDDDPR
ncbi:hypothetical protein GCM10009769_09120 [Curtobacterium luteum]|uniref:N-acetyltransferase domain-containing protein n=2 Tax=Curtobacterium luteum TaxID=33881 RepID=A0A8H9G8A0_9MICO|nr:hypothetical protein GCM10009769_09120 [Curtobacterium luteum]